MTQRFAIGSVANLGQNPWISTPNACAIFTSCFSERNDRAYVPDLSSGIATGKTREDTN
jgi:hypothetical protein